MARGGAREKTGRECRTAQCGDGALSLRRWEPSWAGKRRGPRGVLKSFCAFDLPQPRSTRPTRDPRRPPGSSGPRPPGRGTSTSRPSGTERAHRPGAGRTHGTSLSTSRVCTLFLGQYKAAGRPPTVLEESPTEGAVCDAFAGVLGVTEPSPCVTCPPRPGRGHLGCSRPALPSWTLTRTSALQGHWLLRSHTHLLSPLRVHPALDSRALPPDENGHGGRGPSGPLLHAGCPPT